MQGSQLAAYMETREVSQEQYEKSEESAVSGKLASLASAVHV
jgi:hypothetical protein